MATALPAPGERRHEGLVLDFLAHLELERGLARNTLEAYLSLIHISEPTRPY